MTVGLHDLEILIVHPDASLEISFLARNLFGSDVEHIAVQLVFRLLAHIEDVVLRNLIAGEHKGQTVAEVLNVALIERKPALLQTRLRGKHYVFHAPALVVKQYIENFVILARGGAAIQGLYRDVLPVRVLIAGLFELLLLGREALDNFLSRDALGRSVFERTFLRNRWRSKGNAYNQGKKQNNAVRPIHNPILSDK